MSSTKLPGGNRMPWSAHPDKAGKFWIPYYGRANEIGRLDPASGAIDEFPVPNLGTAAIHSAVPAQDGAVWLTEQGSNKIGRWDPDNPDNHRIPGHHPQAHHPGLIQGGASIWSTGRLSRFDPKTGVFTHIPEIADLLRHRAGSRG